uniref:Uncharacterized protein n=1 Tax=Anopheles funestus TaxID=62324 RepID=A0A182S1M7_ANOFN
MSLLRKKIYAATTQLGGSLSYVWAEDGLYSSENIQHWQNTNFLTFSTSDSTLGL